MLLLFDTPIASGDSTPSAADSVASVDAGSTAGAGSISLASPGRSQVVSLVATCSHHMIRVDPTGPYFHGCRWYTGSGSRNSHGTTGNRLDTATTTPQSYSIPWN